MKFSAVLTSLILVIPLFAGDALAQKNGGKGGKGAKGGNGGKGAGANTGAAANVTAVGAGAAANVTAAGAAANATAVGAGAAANATAVGAGAAANATGVNNAAANNNGDPQTSLTLDPKVIATGFANNGQNVPVAGQVASLTSTNNFINFCLTRADLPITNGKQIKTGSCNPAPMGIIAATTNMPSSKFVSPKNGDDIAANTAFTIQMKINNLVTGNFVNAQSNYYSAPQQVDGSGTIVGHTHFTVQDVGSFTSTNPLDPNVFAFFKGVNGAAVNGVVSEQVANGLPAGVYRVCSMNTDANHTPALVAVAQHGFLDDCVYFSVGGAGGNANPFNGAGAAGAGAAANGTAATPPAAAANGTAATPPAAAANGTAAAPPAAAANGTAAAPPAASSVAAGNGGKKGKGGRGRNGRGRGRGRSVVLGRDY